MRKYFYVQIHPVLVRANNPDEAAELMQAAVGDGEFEIDWIEEDEGFEDDDS